MKKNSVFDNGFLFEPKRENRWIVNLPKIFDIEPYLIRSINVPTYSKGKWENVEIDFLDIIALSTSERLFKIIDWAKKEKRKKWYKLNKNLFEMEVQMLDPTGCTVEKYIINVKDVLKVKFPELNYAKDDIVHLVLTLKISDCFLVPTVSTEIV